MSNKDGGPAFPQNRARDGLNGEYMDSWVDGVGGMSLRDYFAAMVMQGLVGNVDYIEAVHGMATTDQPMPLLLAKTAYGQADAMLDEREREE